MWNYIYMYWYLYFHTVHDIDMKKKRVEFISGVVFINKYSWFSGIEKENQFKAGRGHICQERGWRLSEVINYRHQYHRYQ